jgi:hypothetical protein
MLLVISQSPNLTDQKTRDKTVEKADDGGGHKKRQHHQDQTLVLSKTLLSQHQADAKSDLERHQQPQCDPSAAAVEEAIAGQLDQGAKRRGHEQGHHCHHSRNRHKDEPNRCNHQQKRKDKGGDPL